MSILQDIYNEQYTPGNTSKKMPFSLHLKERAFYDAIEETMGTEFIERHWGALCEAEACRDFANFREGFRLGVSLMMELL